MAIEPMPRCDFDRDGLIMRFETVLAANVEGISPVVDGVMKIVQEMGCAAGKEFEVETAIREGLANAIIHGCREDSRREVQFCVTCDESRGMLIVIRDPGPGFDPKSIPSPILGQEIFSTHGRGIFLINQLMDEVHYKRGGTEIHMVKH